MSRRLLKPLRLAIGLLVLLAFTAAFVDFRGAGPLQRPGQLLAHVQFMPAFVALVTGATVLGLGCLVVLLLTLLFGRVYCSTLCPLGLLQDAVARLARWFRLRRRPLLYRPAVNGLRYGVLAVAALAVAGGASVLTYAHGDPYSNFGRIASGLLRPLAAALNNAFVGPAAAFGLSGLYRVEVPWPGPGILVPAVLMLLLVAGLAAWRERIYCNTLCPVGTLLGLVSRHAAFRLVIDRTACTKCASCLRACKAQCLDLRAGVIDASRCVACFNCLSACPEQGLGYEFAWARTPAAAGSASLPAPSAVTGPTRRAFLAGTLALAPAVLRAATPLAPAPEPRAPVAPPGAGGTERFLARCTACQLCVSACLTGVLRPASVEYGFAGFMKPRLDFEKSFCNYDCRRCGEACPTGAIANLPLADKQLTSIGVARFNQELCVVETEGTDCAACSEHCPTKAVETVPFRDNLRLPRVDDDLCIGCGACQYACPVRPQRAITVEARPTHTRAKRAETEQPAVRPVSGFSF
jgi:ferredoxin